MKTPYSFSVLRYVHDAVTQEFVNIGVAVYAPEAQFLSARCSPHYARITGMFEAIDGERYRQLTRHIASRLDQLGAMKLKSALSFEGSKPQIGALLAQVLPKDDSALQFSPAGVGLTVNPEQTLSDLYMRYVERYTERGKQQRRTDDDVWHVFRDPLQRRFLTHYLSPKTISAPDYKYEFERAFKNEVWHAVEPISFDLLEADSIVEKAIRWHGRLTNLADSPEPFQVSLLLGAPGDSGLRAAYAQAERILQKASAHPELVSEAEAEAFASKLEQTIQIHEPKD